LVEPYVLFARAFAAFDVDSPVLDRLLGGFGIRVIADCWWQR